MENSFNVSATPLQLLLALAFQLWLVVFPIIIIRKLNYLTNLLQERTDTDQDAS